MTAEPPSADDPEPESGSDDAASAPPVAPDRRAARGERYGDIVSEQLGLSAAASARRKRRWIAVSATRNVTAGVVAAVVTLVVTGVAGAIFFTGDDVAERNDAQKEYDARQLPFVTSVRQETAEPENWTMVLDRELTAGEARTLHSTKGSSAVFAYLLSLGGHPLGLAAPLENAPARYQEHQVLDRLEWADTLKLNLLSSRANAVVINDWQVVGVDCRPSSATTVVAFPPQGGVAYEGIRLHIPPQADEPVLIDDTEGQGEPYFTERFVELGGGQPSLGLRVEAIAPPGQSCEWGVKVHYTDVSQHPEDVMLTDGQGKPLRFRTEGIPTEPRQKWVSDGGSFVLCHGNPEGSLCGLA